jgi:hypothetical protein
MADHTLLQSRLRMTANIVNPEGNGLYFEAYGDSALVDEIKAAQTERSKRIAAEWQSIYKSKDPKAIELLTIKAAEATIQYSDDGKVGGKVDAVALSTAGLRWLCHKPACPES